MTKLLSFLLFAFVNLPLCAQTVTHTYRESDEDFRNPERGFYIPLGTKASQFKALDEKQLKQFQTKPYKAGSAVYTVNVSLLYRAYELDIFKDKPLSTGFLKKLQKDFDIIRKSGLKVILRFAYINQSHSGSCGGPYDICPPYGDAPVHIVLQHVQQLKPLLHKNADVIAVLQQGFIGIWGENYFTDYFGCPGDSAVKRITDSSWQHRNIFLKALLNATPKSRMVQVRTPQIKQRYVYGIRSSVNEAALTVNEAFSKSDKARIGLHNDCFLASGDDYGTFVDYGNSASKMDTANTALRKYFEADSRYVASGGETCDDAFSPQNDCAPAGYAETEMRNMHYSYLNASYNNQVNNDWDSLGCMKSIKQNLGYRFVLKNAVITSAIKREKKIHIELHIENKGYASPYNPRPVQLLLRNRQTNKITAYDFKTSIQKWFSGHIRLKQTFAVTNAEKGEYEILLNLPDGYRSLQHNPAYSIRFANEDMWEEATGFNNLKHILIIE